MIRASALLLALSATACSTTPESVVSGQVEAASFHDAVLRVEATGSDGSVVASTIDATGAFALTLPSGIDYRLDVVTTAEHLPVATRPLASGFGSILRVGSDGARVDMGALRLHSPVEGAVTPRELGLGSDALDVCIDGSTAISGDPCIAATATVDCSAMVADEDGGAMSEHHGGRHGRHGGHHGDGPDGDGPDVDGDGRHGSEDAPVVDVPIDLPSFVLPDSALPMSLQCGMVGC